MNRVEFNLIPFDNNHGDRLQVLGNISLSEQLLAIEYCLQGDLSQVVIPDISLKPDRLKDLWEHTCFEFFLKPQNATKYWEFNLSPRQDWNVFRFTNYRENMTEEKSFSSLPFDVSRQAESLKINLDVDLNQIMSKNCCLEMAIATVIETKNWGLSYWSLIHPGIEADFHHRDSFILAIAP